MRRTIERIGDISHPSLDILKNFFENFSYDLTRYIPVTNITIYKKEGVERLMKNRVADLRRSDLGRIVPQNIIDEIYNFKDYLLSIYDVDIIWLMTYMPNTYLEFHIDTDSDRHLINVFDNDRFFNYESTDPLYDHVQMYTEKLKENIDNIDEFNKFFLEFKPEYNSIKVAKSGGIYTFGHSIHNFFNGSNKLRVNFVFEVVEKQTTDSTTN